MAKNNLFDQDLDLQGVASFVNASFETATTYPTAIASKTGGLYFNSTEKALRLNIDGSHWFSTVLFNGSSADVNYLAVFTPSTTNQISQFQGPDSGDALVQVSFDGSTNLIEANEINFTNFLDTAIYVDAVTNGDTRLVTSNAVFDAIAASATSLESIYLKLAGGSMTGDILITDYNRINFFDDTNYITSIDNSAVDINGKVLINLNIANNACLGISSTYLFPANTNVYDVGSSSKKFKDGYFGTTVFTPEVNGNGANLTLIGKDVAAKLVLDSNNVISYSNIIGDTANLRTLGASVNYWANLYSTIVTTNSLVLNSATGLTAVNAAIDDEALDTEIPTALSVWTLFHSIETIEGTAITDMEAVGLVTRHTAAIPYKSVSILYEENKSTINTITIHNTKKDDEITPDSAVKAFNDTPVLFLNSRLKNFFISTFL